MIFLDCEASSLDETYSYPIEVAWGDPVTGIVWAYLINPVWIETWTDWSPEAQALHGLSRARLREHGLPPRLVADEVVRQLTGEAVYVTAWDDKGWVDELTMRTRGDVAAIRWKDASGYLLDLAGGEVAARCRAWDEAWRRLAERGIHPHRAGNDVRHLMETRKLLLGG